MDHAECNISSSEFSRIIIQTLSKLQAQLCFFEDSVVISSTLFLVPSLSPATRGYETQNFSFPFSVWLKEQVFLWQEFYDAACRCYKFKYLRNYFLFDTNIKFFHHAPYQILKDNFLLNLIEIQWSCHKIHIIIEII